MDATIPTTAAPHAPTVLCAMSGGVDSSAAALLLMQQGYRTIGITMELFKGEAFDPETAPDCCWLDDVRDARKVCQRLGIPHRTLDCADRFDACVVQRFCDDYLQGRTPNPCIQCNRHLKLAALQQYRREHRADFVATGHYVRRAFDEQTGTWQLLRGRDHGKDQSYVLYHLTQDDLAHMLFPLGDLEKGQVRALAAAQGFATAEKAESQDICFIPDGDYAAFIQRRLDQKGCPLPKTAFSPGDIVDGEGQPLGRHRGLIHYTIGQRKGIGVAAPTPLYVQGKILSRNQLVATTREGLLCQEVALQDTNVISGDVRPRLCKVEVKLSYRARPVAAQLQLQEDGRALVRLEKPQVRPAPGQSVVAYQEDVVLAGGVVSEHTLA